MDSVHIYGGGKISPQNSKRRPNSRRENKRLITVGSLLPFLICSMRIHFIARPDSSVCRRKSSGGRVARQSWPTFSRKQTIDFLYRDGLLAFWLLSLPESACELRLVRLHLAPCKSCAVHLLRPTNSLSNNVRPERSRFYFIATHLGEYKSLFQHLFFNFSLKLAPDRHNICKGGAKNLYFSFAGTVSFFCTSVEISIRQES